MDYTATQLKNARYIYYEWLKDVLNFEDFEDWLEDKINCLEKSSLKKKTIAKKSAKKVKYHVSSYSPEMGWFCEYDGYEKKKADETYERCKKTYPNVTFEKH